MTHRPYTLPSWQAAAARDGRVTLLVVPLTRLLKRGAISNFGPSDTAGYDWHFRDSEKRWHDVRHSRLLELLPYAPGDLIWCRETYIGAYAYEVNEYKPKDWGNKPIWFPADGPIPERFVGQFWHKARSPVTMPKWAARTWLRCTGVEVRRVQTISEDEAKQNGATSRPNCSGFLNRNDGWSMDWSRVGEMSQWAMKPPGSPKFTPLKETDISLEDPRMAFASQFNETRGGDAWDANPWASFTLVEKISKENI